MPLDAESLFAEFAPLVQRLLQQPGARALSRRDSAASIYDRFCALIAAYEPARGVPLRPYLVRHLTDSLGGSALDDPGIADSASHDSDHARREGPAEPPAAPPRGCEREPGSGLSLARLPERQRDAFLLTYYEGFTIAEIADRLAIEPSDARLLVLNGLDSLRAHNRAGVRHQPNSDHTGAQR